MAARLSSPARENQRFDGYLRLFSKPSDDNAFLRVVNLRRREIGLRPLEKMGTSPPRRREFGEASGYKGV